MEDDAAPPAAPVLTKREIKKAKKAERLRLRAILAQQKALEAKRDQLKREQGYTALSYERASADWERMMVTISHKDARFELNALWADVVHTMDRKNHGIERLTENISQASDQFQRAAESHLRFIDHSMNTFNTIVQAMRNMYELQVRQMISQLHQERNDKMNNLNRIKGYFESIMHGSNVKTDANLENAEINFNFVNEDLSNANVEKNDMMLDSTVEHIEKLYRQMKKTIEKTQSTSMTKERCKRYEALTDRELKDRAVLEKNQKDIEKTHRLIMRLMEERRRVEAESMLKLNEIRREKDYFTECFFSIRDGYETDMRKDQKDMRALMSHTFKTNTHLSDIERKGGLILAVTAAVRKLQTEKEKICPLLNNTKEACAPVHYDATLEDLNHLSEMDQFWLKVSMSTAQNVALAEEKAHLTEENELLRNLIRKYCRQADYNRTIYTLNISSKPTVGMPAQEASHMTQLKRNSKKK